MSPTSEAETDKSIVGPWLGINMNTTVRQGIDTVYEYGNGISILSLVVSAMTGDGLQGNETYIVIGIAVLVQALKWVSNYMDKKHGPLQPPENVKPPAPEG